MVTIEQIKAGMSDFAFSTMIPRMDENRQFWAGVSTEFLKRKADHVMRALSKREWAHMIGLFDENGNIDIETAFESMMEQFKRQPKFSTEIPYFGCFSFTAHDIQELYNKIKNA